MRPFYIFNNWSGAARCNRRLAKMQARARQLAERAFERYLAAMRAEFAEGKLPDYAILHWEPPEVTICHKQ